MQLSKHFHLREFLRSQQAARHGIDMTPTKGIVRNLMHLSVNFLDPIRDYIKRPIFVSSGYRPPALNVRIGGSKSSSHMLGLAADIVCFDMTTDELFAAVKSLGLEFDQVIHEHTWLHIGVCGVPRGEFFRIPKVIDDA